MAQIRPKILFIYPKPSVKFDTAHCLPLGMGYITAVLEKNNFNVSVIDMNVQKTNLTKKLNNVDIVGIFTLTPNVYNAWKIAQKIKQLRPKTWVILGGPHASTLPEESLQKDSVDLVVRGEGEETILALCQAWPNKFFKPIKGLSYKKRRKVIHNPSRPFIRDLDSLPFPAWHLFPYKKYTSTRPTWVDQAKLNSGSMVTSRGCPFHCTFCFKGVHGYEYRFRSPENVIKEMKFLKEKYHINFIEFQDDNFSLNPHRALKICQLMVKEKLNIKWSIPNGISRVDNINKELLQWCKKAGCVDIWFAVESGSQRVLEKVIKKRTTLVQIKRAVRLAKQVGFTVGGFVCMGNPGETKKDLEKTIDFVCRLPLDRCQFTIVTPFPGSELYRQMAAENKLLIHHWDQYGPFENKVFIDDPVTSPDMVRSMYRRAFRSFYLRPKYILKAMVNPINYKNWRLIFTQLWRFAK